MDPAKGKLIPYACFKCRRAFKRPWQGRIPERPCPNCGAQAVALNPKFKAPRSDNVEQWKKVEFLVSRGFLFQSLRDGEGHSITYPESLRDAAAFVERYGHMVAAVSGPNPPA
jgi:hypothetical protein